MQEKFYNTRTERGEVGGIAAGLSFDAFWVDVQGHADHMVRVGGHYIMMLHLQR